MFQAEILWWQLVWHFQETEDQCGWTRRSKGKRDEVRAESCRGCCIMEDLAGHGKEFGSYPELNICPWRVWVERDFYLLNMTNAAIWRTNYRKQKRAENSVRRIPQMWELLRCGMHFEGGAKRTCWWMRLGVWMWRGIKEDPHVSVLSNMADGGAI